MSFKKILLVLVGITIFIAANAFSTAESTLKERFGLLIVFLLGLHFVYGYLFNTEIHMTGYTVPAGERSTLRIGLFFAGVGVMLGVIIYSFGLLA